MSKTKFISGEFTPKNPQKYVGKYPIVYRSSWEFQMMAVFDDNPNVVAWASESMSIPYKNPLTNHWAMYIPDFTVVFVDREGKQRAEIIEIKPLKERGGPWAKEYKGRLTERDKLVQVVNAAKWYAAAAFCAKKGFHFRVASEDELFAWKPPKRKK